MDCCRGRNAHTLAAHDEIAHTLLDILAREEDVEWLTAAAPAKGGASGTPAAPEPGSDGDAAMALAVLRELLMCCQVGCRSLGCRCWVLQTCRGQAWRCPSGARRPARHPKPLKS